MENPVGISRRIGLNPVPDVHANNASTPVSQLCQPIPQDEYNQFNLQNTNALTPPMWKNNENTLDFKKFRRSCMCIFDGPMAHITNCKVKTNMFLIWAGPDGEDICNNFQFSLSRQYNLDAVFEAFERYCKPICNFPAATFKFRVVKQHETETINPSFAFYIYIYM